MRKTIFIPDDLGARLEEYLRENPNETASGVLQEGLALKLRLGNYGKPRDLSPLLALAGFAKNTKRPNREDLQPEDQWVVDDNATR
jgi:hypothetical protein